MVELCKFQEIVWDCLWKRVSSVTGLHLYKETLHLLMVDMANQSQLSSSSLSSFQHSNSDNPD